jgi:hypothetical protein
VNRAEILPRTCPLTNQTGNEAQLKQVGGESTMLGLMPLD